LGNPLKNFPLASIASPNGPTQNFTGDVFDEAPLIGRSILEFLPCVLYECSRLLNLTYVSANVDKMLGIQAHKLLGNRALWEERILPEDLTLLCEKINKLETDETASSIHRIIDDRGLPVWVSHSFRRVHSEVICGCIVPLRNEKRIQDLQSTVISRFIHKLGNHFQLLNLVINSLRKTLPESRETEVLKQTVEKAVDLTRTFSDYSQSPTWFSEINFFEIINAAAVSRRASFAEKGIVLDQKVHESVRGVTMSGDPYLLELALGSILENAFEASQSGGTVVLKAMAEISDSRTPVVRLSVADSGSGIEMNNLENIAVPFFTTKLDHDGLGLSVAVRLIEMHGGLLTVQSKQGQGTEVAITLPADGSRQFAER
jgi:signal transduction histidine kinase